MTLITSRAFLPLFLTQFLGAFNDNLLKNSLVILITYKLAVEAHQNPQILVTIAAGVFILPFFLFSSLAGQLADKYERTLIIKIVKVSEVLIAILGSLGLIYHKPWFLIIVLFAAGVHSTFFGPIKYTLLPQLIPASLLITANAYVSTGTFVAILLGTIYGGILVMREFGTFIVSLLLCSIAFLGLLACFFIPRSPAPSPNLIVSHNVFKETWKIIGYSRYNYRVFIAILGISWFWFIGATFLAQMPNFVKFYLHAEYRVVTAFLTIFTIGIGIGSFICSKLLRGKITSIYIPYAVIGITIVIIDLYFASKSIDFNNISGLLEWQVFINMASGVHVMLDLLLIAALGGFYIVPLYAIMQHESEINFRARIIAANNVFNALFMVISAILTLGMLGAHRTIPEVFMIIAILNIPVAFLLQITLNKK